MFICYGCTKSRQHGEMVVLETRPKEYFTEDRFGSPVKVGEGTEIVMERRFCDECLNGEPVEEPAGDTEVEVFLQ